MTEPTVKISSSKTRFEIADLAGGESPHVVELSVFDVIRQLDAVVKEATELEAAWQRTDAEAAEKAAQAEAMGAEGAAPPPHIPAPRPALPDPLEKLIEIVQEAGGPEMSYGQADELHDSLIEVFTAKKNERRKKITGAPMSARSTGSTRTS